MVYTDLRAAIQEYTENYESTFAERVDTFIRQAENRIAHLVRLPPFRKQNHGTFTINSSFLAPPTDYLSADSLFVMDQAQMYALENKEPEFILTCYPVMVALGRPRYYGKIDDSTLIIGPTPDAEYPALLNYFAYPPSITTAPNGRSYLGDRCESLLLYACLVEAYTFMKGEADLLNFYDSKLKEAVGLYKQLGDGRARKDSYQEPDRRVEV
jgi:hypothetical protein